MDLFQNPDGSTSSRRIFGCVLIAAGLFGWYFKLDGNIALGVMGLGATLAGVTTFDWMKK
jgi:hypothetical protein